VAEGKRQNLTLNGDNPILTDFRQRASTLFERIIDYWKDYAVSSEITRYTKGITSSRSHRGMAAVSGMESFLIS